MDSRGPLRAYLMFLSDRHIAIDAEDLLILRIILIEYHKNKQAYRLSLLVFMVFEDLEL